MDDGEDYVDHGYHQLSPLTRKTPMMEGEEEGKEGGKETEMLNTIENWLE